MKNFLPKLYVTQYTAYYINLALRLPYYEENVLPLFILAENVCECDRYIDDINYGFKYTGKHFEIFRYSNQIGGAMFVPKKFNPEDQVEKILWLCKNSQVRPLSEHELDKMFASNDEEKPRVEFRKIDSNNKILHIFSEKRFEEVREMALQIAAQGFGYYPDENILCYGHLTPVDLVIIDDEQRTVIYYSGKTYFDFLYPNQELMKLKWH